MECKVRDSCGGSGTGETHRRMRRGGSAHAPRKASMLKRKSTTPKSNKGYENSLVKSFVCKRSCFFVECD
ncbi:hypothetical protein LCY76_05995 [Fictibacillus sp. KIGAM418]|uniref:Uncharacterized protein n=1 Tax=Fictibacillus marinisediminis TaxID=2878389 RepID=A0A9X2BG23_9BACL|nr:hypothetical protein [Fictibacillus marinisediminis]MCK6256153.1 hypothetical protein [Fictibacillus marinisediminis]